jgi:thiol-disulfide isomerase/thioredoxin
MPPSPIPSAHRYVVALAIMMALSLPSHAQDAADAPQRPPLEEATASEILDAVAQNDAQVTVVNVWATWCAPCVEEFPAFVRFGREYAGDGVEVVFVSVDGPDAKSDARAFLADHGVTDRSFLKAQKSTPFVNAFSEDWSGAVPATFLYGPTGTLLDHWESRTSFEELASRVRQHLD